MALRSLFTIVMLLPAVAGSAQVATPASPPVDISGLWLVVDPGSNDWEQWFHHSQGDADVLPQWIPMFNEQRAREVKEPANTTPQTPACAQGNVARMMASSPGIVIVSAPGEVLMGQEAAKGRIIYTDGRSLPDPKATGFVPSGLGHSVGRWDGTTLRIDTHGFPASMCDSRRPVLDVPGRGRAKDTTRLSETYRLTAPDTLVAEFLWEDPTIYRTPWRYTYTFKRVGGLPIEANPEPESDPTYKPAPAPAGR